MKFLFVGPNEVLDKMITISKSLFPGLECVSIKYDKYAEVVDMINEYRGVVDAILFAGKAPYRYFEKYGSYAFEKYGLIDYVPRHRTTMYKALLEITYKLGGSLGSLSIDTFDLGLMKELYKDIDIPFDEQKMYFAHQRLLDSDYIAYVEEFHCDNYSSGKVDYCITGLAEVYRRLKKRKIPCVLTVPEEDIIRQSIRDLQARVIANRGSDNQIVVLAVRIEYPKELSSISEDDYMFLSRRIMIMDKLYNFSNRISGVVVERGKEFLIFTGKKQIEQETSNFHNLALCASLMEVEMINSYIGIGYGKTANEAKAHAFMGLKMSHNYSPGSAFVVFENHETIGPLNSWLNEEDSETIDERFYQISKETSLSVNSVHKVLSKVLESDSTEFTSKELAMMTGVTIRTMDRIIQKLSDAGYCEVVSEKQMTTHGRPSRILRFYLTKPRKTK